MKGFWEKTFYDLMNENPDKTFIEVGTEVISDFMDGDTTKEEVFRKMVLFLETSEFDNKDFKKIQTLEDLEEFYREVY